MSIEIITFHRRKCIWKCRLENGGHFAPTSQVGHMALIRVTQAGAPLHSHWLATRRVTGRRPRCIHWKYLWFGDTLFSLNLSYHSFVSVHDIQQKRLLNKISVYTFTHPGGHHRVADATLSVACTCDSCATFRSPVTSSEVTWITWSPLWRSTHSPNSEIFNARNNTFFKATAQVVTDAVAKVLGWQWVTICNSARAVFCAGARGCQANQWRQPGSEKWHGLAQNMWLTFLPTDFRTDKKETFRI